MKRNGFTLIEMIMAILIIGVLAVVVLPSVVSLVRHAKEGAARAGLGAVRSALAIGYANSLRDAASAGAGAYPTLEARHFASGEFPWNPLTNSRNLSAVAEIPLKASITGQDCSYWYIPGTPGIQPNAGRAGACVDVAYPDPDKYRDDPSTW